MNHCMHIVSYYKHRAGVNLCEDAFAAATYEIEATMNRYRVWFTGHVTTQHTEYIFALSAYEARMTYAYRHNVKLDYVMAELAPRGV